ncbi:MULTISPECIES: type II toxin-antitoxin system ParD family antitoxin [Candidatus Regiella]|uniref:Antitoxin ParD n=1 Tax=Candidatus Regiella insecticola 5.15 TaxID=1005043 RepID=G2H2M8_9ENTR|nr:type II toxin-antitoxin system ParD family antitoxin [Candidatus Regiella insecticola]EGY27752.1 putative transcriptional regulators containing the CopG/Arc/MetJ DNA-binding domain [Candidatus Regiella insecticola 5.15]
MPTSVALSPHFEEFIQKQINSGRYNNVSEVIRAGLRELEDQAQAKKLEALQSAVTRGINSGEGVPAEEVFKQLRHKYQQMSENGRK